MFWIIVVACLIVYGLVVANMVKEEKLTFKKVVLAILNGLFVSSILFLSLYLIWSLILNFVHIEYTHPETVEVIQIVESDEGYVSETGDNKYLYYVQTSESMKTSYVLTHENVTIVRDSEYEDNAKLLENVSRPKNKFLTYGFRREKTEYVFYVPNE